MAKEQAEYKANQRPADVTSEELAEARKTAEKISKGTRTEHDIDVGYHCHECKEFVRNKGQTCSCSSN